MLFELEYAVVPGEELEMPLLMGPRSFVGLISCTFRRAPGANLS